MRLAEQWQRSESALRSWPKLKVIATGLIILLPWAGAGIGHFCFAGNSGFGFLAGLVPAYVILTYLSPGQEA